MKPTTFEEWKHCITVQCGIPLTLSYVEERLSALNDKQNYHTKKFIKTWGQAHFQNVMAWFEKAQRELKG